MPNPQIVDLVAPRMASLVWPGDDKNKPSPIPLPMFAAATRLTPEQAEAFASQANLPSANIAKLTVEAIVHLIETEGASEIVPKAELDELRKAADDTPPEKHRQPKVLCSTCGNPLFRINVDTENPRVNGQVFLETLATLNPECPHAQKVVAGA